MVRALLDHGGNAQFKNDQGNSPADVAKTADIRRLLEKSHTGTGRRRDPMKKEEEWKKKEAEWKKKEAEWIEREKEWKRKEIEWQEREEQWKKKEEEWNTQQRTADKTKPGSPQTTSPRSSSNGVETSQGLSSKIRLKKKKQGKSKKGTGEIGNEGETNAAEAKKKKKKKKET